MVFQAGWRDPSLLCRHLLIVENLYNLVIQITDVLIGLPVQGGVARLSESVKIHSPAVRGFLRFPKVSRPLATSLVHGSRNPARKTIRYSCNNILSY